MLAEKPFHLLPALTDANKLLDKLVKFNTVVFSDEKDTKQWMGGFSVSNIQYRLWHLHKTFNNYIDVNELESFAAKWDPFIWTPEDSTVAGVQELAPFDSTAFFNETIACLNAVIPKLVAVIKEYGN